MWDIGFVAFFVALVGQIWMKNLSFFAKYVVNM
jgi:hypothetical protein